MSFSTAACPQTTCAYRQEDGKSSSTGDEVGDEDIAHCLFLLEMKSDEPEHIRLLQNGRQQKEEIEEHIDADASSLMTKYRQGLCSSLSRAKGIFTSESKPMMSAKYTTYSPCPGYCRKVAMQEDNSKQHTSE